MVVRRRFLEATASSPVLMMTKQPVQVDFSAPGVKHPLADGRRLLVAGNAADRQRGVEQRLIQIPNSAAQSITVGRPCRGTPNRSRRSSSQSFS